MNTHLWGCYAGLFIIQALCVSLLSVAIPIFKKTFLVARSYFTPTLTSLIEFRGGDEPHCETFSLPNMFI